MLKQKIKQKLGLTANEAKKRLSELGYNEISDVFKVSPLTILFRQVKRNFVIYLLTGAVIISFSVGKTTTAYAILITIVLIVAIGFFQEYKAEKAVKALKQMIMPISIVYRNGKETEVPSSELVPGDVVVLRTGEKVPADCVVIQETELRVDESMLTGESAAIKKLAAKNPDKANKENQIFMGTHIITGKCIGLVTLTGMRTQFGKIASMISGAEKELPLQIKVNQVAKVMVMVALTFSFLTGVIMLLRSSSISGDVVVDIVIVIIALSVAAFPEGFPVVLVTTLASGAYSMAKKNAIVNRMSIIETLGETTVICSDKTGTITTGEMTAKMAYLDSKHYEISGVGYTGEGKFNLAGEEVSIKQSGWGSLFLKAAVLCNDSKIERTGSDMEYQISGTPTEAALLVMAAKDGVFKDDLNSERIEEIPFSSERKMMAVVCQEKREKIVYAKGAPEVLLAKCPFIQHGDEIVPFAENEKQSLEKLQENLTKKKYRVIALAYKKIEKLKGSVLDDNLIFLGFVALEDPPREEVKEAIESCKQAGIKVKMITGDNKETATEIAREVGIIGALMTGAELDLCTDKQLAAAVKKVSIFARVKPEHKIRIVRALKKNGEIVTMTGDGVNDAPALKEAHIGVAMGKNGTDVSREASDLILKDDNFATIVTAIKEGRTIFSNIQKFITYQLSVNYSEIFVIFFGILFGLPIPLLALQILFMNMINDSIPALSLGFSPASQDIMQQKPRSKTGILTPDLIKRLAFVGTVMGIVTLGVFVISLRLTDDLVVARTYTFLTLIFLVLANAFNFRSFRFPVIGRSLFVNKYLVGASLLSIASTIIVIHTDLNKVFELTPIPALHWVFVIALSLVIVLVSDLGKYFLPLQNSKNATVR